ncbi:class I SAM-dependent methyltransferase [Bacillus sp. Marseille-Q1617]|uniref:class I SAM-dependent methyltransferase n=1 Tax=Bacillus sp. Marseille-Q1617 TaxID=2736887 RepID=UPI00158B0094|nr:class I SAM-dependent methyltransferase [Bacillus sp. Marseille-Q1617]
MSFSHYGKLCTEVYDLTKEVGQSFSGDIEFYREKLRDTKGRILEAMVGSGRVMIPLLANGLKVDGMDDSPEMLASCRHRLEERGLQAELYESNLQTLDLPHQYEAIIIPGGSFLLIDDREESMHALRKLHDHLEPGGRLMMDVFLPDAQFETGKVNTSVFPLPDGDTITMESKLVEADFFYQRKVTHLKYEKWRSGSLIETELQRFAIRWYGVEELRLILKEIGFSKINICADFVEGKQPSGSHEKIIYIAEK